MLTQIGRSTPLRAGMLAFALAGCGLLSTIVAPPPAAAHNGTHWCQCVDYIKHYYGISGSTGNAKDMGPNLVRYYGFRRIYTPVVGAVVIFQPAFGSVNAYYGHVGRIVAVTDLGTYWQVKVRSANYGGSQTMSNCTNMNDVVFHKYTKGSSAVSYYRR